MPQSDRLYVSAVHTSCKTGRNTGFSLIVEHQPAKKAVVVTDLIGELKPETEKAIREIVVGKELATEPATLRAVCSDEGWMLQKGAPNEQDRVFVPGPHITTALKALGLVE